MTDMKQFLLDRLHYLGSDDEKDWLKYHKKYGIEPHPNHEIFLASVHKARTAIINMPMEKRKASKKWLIEHGYQSFDDGEVEV